MLLGCHKGLWSDIYIIYEGPLHLVGLHYPRLHMAGNHMLALGLLWSCSYSKLKLYVIVFVKLHRLVQLVVVPYLAIGPVLLGV